MHELTFVDDTWSFLSTIPSGVQFHSNSDTWFAADRLLTGRDSEVQPRLEWEVIGALARDVLTDPHPAFYLPADRTGLMNAHRAMVSVLIRSATMGGGIARADPVPPLSGLRGDFLEQLAEMASDAEALDARDVGVWLFEPAGDGPGSNNVKEIALDADTGLFPSGFDTVAAALHNEWAKIADPQGNAE